MVDKVANNGELFSQLKEKVLLEITNGYSYEALQYIQSFIARKKKIVGRKETSAMVFFGAKLLIDNDAAPDAGTLLAWFIEDGAGDDFLFVLEDRELNDTDIYCDTQKLTEVLQALPSAKSSSIVTKVYGPIHKAILSKKNIQKDGSLSKRLNRLEEIFASIFEEKKDWLSAYKSVLRLENTDAGRAARILDSWSKEGYPTERPLFFARAVLQLLSEGKIPLASALITASEKFIHVPEASSPELAAAIGIWNFATILTGLATLPSKPRVDPPKIFGIVAQIYYPLLVKTDQKLSELLDKIGLVVFGLSRPGADAPNPMSLLSSMFGGGGANSDQMAQMQQMMASMQGIK